MRSSCEGVFYATGTTRVPGKKPTFTPRSWCSENFSTVSVSYWNFYGRYLSCFGLIKAFIVRYKKEQKYQKPTNFLITPQIYSEPCLKLGALPIKLYTAPRP
jgi:hypothetical protein